MRVSLSINEFVRGDRVIVRLKRNDWHLGRVLHWDDRKGVEVELDADHSEYEKAQAQKKKLPEVHIYHITVSPKDFKWMKRVGHPGELNRPLTNKEAEEIMKLPPEARYGGKYEKALVPKIEKVKTTPYFEKYAKGVFKAIDDLLKDKAEPTQTRNLNKPMTTRSWLVEPKYVTEINKKLPGFLKKLGFGPAEQYQDQFKTSYVGFDKGDCRVRVDGHGKATDRNKYFKITMFLKEYDDHGNPKTYTLNIAKKKVSDVDEWGRRN